MPGLQNPESQLGVPLLVRGELIGVLILESETFSIPRRRQDVHRTARQLPGGAITYYAADECIVVEDDGPNRGLPARILWRLVSIREETGDEFTNREPRLDSR